jgi:hypothetical protein
VPTIFFESNVVALLNHSISLHWHFSDLPGPIE